MLISKEVGIVNETFVSSVRVSERGPVDVQVAGTNNSLFAKVVVFRILQLLAAKFLFMSVFGMSSLLRLARMSRRILKKRVSSKIHLPTETKVCYRYWGCQSHRTCATKCSNRIYSGPAGTEYSRTLNYYSRYSCINSVIANRKELVC
jgi:hypothetical protein